MNISEIKEIIQAAVESGVAELEVQRGENRVRIVRGGVQQEVIVAAPVPVAASPAPQPVVHMAPAPLASAVETDNTIPVKSPIVGTFYAAGSPGSAPFVSVGDVVKPGQVLCIVESMKLMNEIESEVSGTIVARLVENGAPVEYGATLFTVRPH
jgi:acetyl-CoA carboxylase biotin carboxyl carrier protein